MACHSLSQCEINLTDASFLIEHMDYIRTALLQKKMLQEIHINNILANAKTGSKKITIVIICSYNTENNIECMYDLCGT